MRPSRPRPQARHPNAGRSSPTLRVPLGLPHGRASPQPGVPPSGVRIVDTRSSVPALTGLDDGYVGYYQAPLRSSDSPSTVSSFEPITPTSKRRPVSPYGFIPIPPGDRAASHRFSPITTPHYDFRHGTPSPSLMSTITDGTIDSLMTIDSPRLANIGFSTPPPLYRPGSPQGRESPRPRTPTGRKSPFTKNDDDSSRKTRIKTEMCMHYAHSRPCPFGANCTYAHGEEELQMTKLLDLEKAGLIDIETYRTKPCLTWVMTGSWYVQTLRQQLDLVRLLRASTSRPSHQPAHLGKGAQPFTILEWAARAHRGFLIRRHKATRWPPTSMWSRCTTSASTKSITGHPSDTSSRSSRIAGVTFTN